MSNHQNNAHILARAVIIDQNHILLCKTRRHKNNYYFLPGGHIENNETAQDALSRELMEEAGVSATIHRFLGCLEYQFTPDKKEPCHTHEYNFLFKASSSELLAQTPIPHLEEHIELIWVQLDTLINIDFRPTALKELLPEWIESDHGNAYQSKSENY